MNFEFTSATFPVTSQIICLPCLQIHKVGVACVYVCVWSACGCAHVLFLNFIYLAIKLKRFPKGMAEALLGFRWMSIYSYLYLMLPIYDLSMYVIQLTDTLSSS